ncbi:hypothetical protein GCM10009720_08780 [Yaniella flava]|uniref:Uncharacterized protein n=1 Tax=Yaniella flava TaxID=287930 RepID=A0ABP5FNT9_9MICC
MQAEEFYPPYRTSFDGIGKIIEQAYHGYDDSTPIMVQPDSSGQVKDIANTTVMQLLGDISYDHYTTSPSPAIRTTTVNLYGERKGVLNGTENPDNAHYMVVTASAVINLDMLGAKHEQIFKDVYQIIGTKADQRDAERQRQTKLDRRAKLQAELDALDEDLGLEE